MQKVLESPYNCGRSEGGSYFQWCIAKNGGGYTQRVVEKGLNVPYLFMITEVSIRCQKNLEVGIRRIPPPQYTTGYFCIAVVEFVWFLSLISL